jgi:hypothetical protein
MKQLVNIYSFSGIKVFIKGVVFLIFSSLYLTLLHLTPLRFLWVGGCWDRTIPSTTATSALAVRLSYHSAIDTSIYSLIIYITLTLNVRLCSS